MTTTAVRTVRQRAGERVLAPSVVPPSGSLEALAVAVDEVAAIQERIDALSGDRLVALERARRAALRVHGGLLDKDSYEVRRAPESRRAELARRALVAEVGCALRVSQVTAGRMLDDAQILATQAPATLAGLCAGRFSATHAHTIAQAVAGLEQQAVAMIESAALASAPVQAPGVFARTVRRLRETAHPEPVSVRHQRAMGKRGVWVDPDVDGMAWLSAFLPAVTAHAICDKLTTTAERAIRSGDARTRAQLRADALTALALDTGHHDTDCPRDQSHHDDDTAHEHDREHDGDSACCTRAMTAGLPDSLAITARSVTPRVHVTVPVVTLLGADEPATLDGHIPIDPATARALTARAPSLRRLLTHPETGAVLSVGRDTYTVPADLREYLAVRDVTCRFPGCTTPTTRCDLDHTTDWAHGGTTDADNLAHLCRTHHTLKHQTTWDVEHLPGGVLAWTSPTGRLHLTYPTTPLGTDRDLAQRPPPDLDDMYPYDMHPDDSTAPPPEPGALEPPA